MKPKFPIALLLATAVTFLPYQASAQAKPCPPGLAKKNPPCVPPGLAKKGVTSEEYLSHRYKTGEHLREDDAYQVLDNWWEYGLPDPQDDELYLLLDDEIFRVASATLKVLQAWQAVRALSN